MIVKRGNGYGVSVYDPSLKRKRWVGTFKTKAEAREAERQAARRRHVSGRITCGEFVKRWLAEYPRAAGATRRTYGYGVKVFAEEFSRVRLADLDRVTARGWALRHPQSNVRVIRAMFNDAINDGLHPGPNPFANLRFEQSRGRKDLTALTRAELYELGDVAVKVHGEFGSAFRAMILFAGYVGLRPGEMCALERADVDRDEVTIRQNLDGTGTLKPPRMARSASLYFRRQRENHSPMYRLVSTCRGYSSRRAAVGSAKAACTTTGTQYARRSAGRAWMPRSPVRR